MFLGFLRLEPVLVASLGTIFADFPYGCFVCGFCMLGSCCGFLGMFFLLGVVFFLGLFIVC